MPGTQVTLVYGINEESCGKVTRTPGKDGALVMLVDWSGSVGGVELLVSRSLIFSPNDGLGDEVGAERGAEEV
jgi:hypothetical protein